MRSRLPSRSRLPGVVTLWNWVGGDTNGKPVFQRTILRHVAFDESRGTKLIISVGDVTEEDKFYLEIYNPTSAAKSPEGLFRHWAPAYEFQLAPDKTLYWTLQPGKDWIGIGVLPDEAPSEEGTGRRNDFKISVVDTKRGGAGELHHWEVYGR